MYRSFNSAADDIPSSLQLVIKKMSKRDPLTKTKGIEELHQVLQTTPSLIDILIPHYPSIFNKYALDIDRRVRETFLRLHLFIVRSGSKKLAPILKSIITTWMLVQFDTSKDVSANARTSFNLSFSKVNAVLKHCQYELLSELSDIIMKQRMEDMSDARFASIEEQMGKYSRIVSGAFDALSFIIVDADELLESRIFWTKSSHMEASIRSSVYRLMRRILLSKPALVDCHLEVIATCYLERAFEERDTSCFPALWDSLLLLTRTYPNIWTEGAVMKLQGFFEQGVYGSQNVSYPCLLPLLGHLPAIGMVDFMADVWVGVKTLDRFSTKVVMVSYYECAVYFKGESDIVAPLKDVFNATVGRLSSSDILREFVNCLSTCLTNFPALEDSILDLTLGELQIESAPLVQEFVLMLSLSSSLTAFSVKLNSRILGELLERLETDVKVEYLQLFIKLMSLEVDGEMVSVLQDVFVTLLHKYFSSTPIEHSETHDAGTEILAESMTNEGDRSLEIAGFRSLSVAENIESGLLLDAYISLLKKSKDYSSYEGILELVLQNSPKSLPHLLEIAISSPLLDAYIPQIIDLKERIEVVSSCILGGFISQPVIDSLLRRVEGVITKGAVDLLVIPKRHTYELEIALEELLYSIHLVGLLCTVSIPALLIPCISSIAQLSICNPFTVVTMTIKQSDYQNIAEEAKKVIQIVSYARDVRLTGLSDLCLNVDHCASPSDLIAILTFSALVGGNEIWKDVLLEQSEWLRMASSYTSPLCYTMVISDPLLSVCFDISGKSIYGPGLPVHVSSHGNYYDHDGLSQYSHISLLTLSILQHFELAKEFDYLYCELLRFVLICKDKMYLEGPKLFLDNGECGFENEVLEIVKGRKRALADSIDLTSNVVEAVSNQRVVALLKATMKTDLSELESSCDTLLDDALKRDKLHDLCQYLEKETRKDFVSKNNLLLLRYVRLKYDAEISKEGHILTTRDVEAIRLLVSLVDGIDDLATGMSRFIVDLTIYFLKLARCDSISLALVFYCLRLWCLIKEKDSLFKIDNVVYEIDALIFTHFVKASQFINSKGHFQMQEELALYASSLRPSSFHDTVAQHEEDLFKLLYSENEQVQKSTYFYLASLVKDRVLRESVRVEMEQVQPNLPLGLTKLSTSNSFGFLLNWLLITDHFIDATFLLKQSYTNDIRALDLIPEFLSHIYTTLDVHGSPFNLSLWQTDTFYIEAYDSSLESSLPVLSAHLYLRTLKTLSVLIRLSLSSLKSRQTILAIEGYTEKHFSPILITAECNAIQELSDEELSVKINTTTHDINATYTFEEAALDIIVKMPSCFPLKHVEVASGSAGGRQAGISDARWRAWLLSVTSITLAQNGSIADALTIFRKKVSLHFEGIEDCAICYAVISASDRSTPQKSCKTCKQVFHGSCLFKWFKSSGQSTCPLCRQPM